MTREFDMVVIGGGMAGLNAVERAAKLGLRVAVVERDRVGGTCPLRGCIPTKALVRSAEVAHEARRAAEFGIHVGEVRVDFRAVMERVRGIIDRGATATQAWLDGVEGAELFRGEGRMEGPGRVVVGEHTLTAPRIVIATGAVPAIPPIEGLDRTPHLTSDDVLRLDALPERLLVIGAGPIALELGQALGRLGASVTLVDLLPSLLPHDEPELVGELQQRLEGEGIAFRFGVTVQRTEPAEGGVRMHIRGPGGDEVLEGDALLVATGRVPAVQPLHLEAAGIRDARRGVPVDDHLMARDTQGVWAAGDVLGPPFGAFTPVARHLGVEVVEYALGTREVPVDTGVGCRAIFTDPELASVGLTEAAARAAGLRVRVGTGRFRGGKARAWGEEHGQVRIVAEEGTGRILGAHILAYHASDLVHPVAVAMTTGTGAETAMRATSHVHPTLGEVVQAAVEDATGGRWPNG